MLNKIDDYETRELINEAGYRYKVEGNVDDGVFLKTLLNGECIDSRQIDISYPSCLYTLKSGYLSDLSFDIALAHYETQMSQKSLNEYMAEG